jgi:hypothetical protein
VGPDHREILHPLRRTRVRYVDGDLEVVPDAARLALERARKTRLRQREPERELVHPPREDRYRRLQILLPPDHLSLVDEVLVILHRPAVSGQ